MGMAAPPLARLANAVLASRGVGSALKNAAGITTARPAPRLDPDGGLRARLAKQPDGVIDRAPESSSVVVWPDTFTNVFDPQLGLDLVASLGLLGERVAVPKAWACCGRTLYDFGMLNLAKRSLRKLVNVLRPWTELGVPVVVPEPSCLAAFRDELPALLADDPDAARLANLARSPAEHLVATGLADKMKDRAPAGPALLHPHCHQRSVIGTRADEEVLSALGYGVEVLDGGCCGLAGSFGFDAHHEPVSRKIGEDLWLPKLRAGLQQAESPGALVMDGFSCRTQLQHLDDGLLDRSSTLPGLLRRALEDSTPPSPT